MQQKMGKSMIIPLSVGVIFFTAIIGALQFQRSGTVEQLGLDKLASQVQGLSPEEQERRAYINRLPITQEKKDFLINRQIFLGAGRHMVVVAIGKPMRRRDMRTTPGEAIEAWVYHFDDQYRPTILEFDQFKLIKAYKVSAIEVEKLGTEVAEAQ